MQKIEINCGGRVFAVECENKPKTAKITEISNNGVSVYKLDFEFENEFVASEINVGLAFAMKNILQLYSPVSYFKRNRMIVQWFNPSAVKSNFYDGLPSLSAVKDGETNYVTVAVSDAENDSRISFCVSDFDEKEEVTFKVSLLCGKEKKKIYSTYLRIDEREIPLTETLKDQTAWFSEFYPSPERYPACCDDALYSTWYNFHQHPSDKKLLSELELAAKLGFKTVIIDDGWQYDGDGTSDYIDCGDWAFSKEKFPDPAGFVKKVHDLGMKAVLWFPAPFVGFNTNAYKKFKDKLLYETGRMTKDGGAINAGILDVRYKCVRDHIIDTVKSLMRYGFDGMKIDFVDWFAVKDETPPYNSKMDERYVSDACVKFMSELYCGINDIKPDAMVEFRQNYVGPSITRFCNMLRVADCAFDSVTNRIGIADMRMLDYNLAVHSDMLYWAKTETAENVAKQLLYIAFGVPQISVLLKEIPESHTAILKNFISYWTTNRDILLHGKLTTEGSDCTYSALYTEGKNKNIVALYLKNDLVYSGKATDVLNASRSETVYMDLGDRSIRVKVFDLTGNIVSEQTLSGINAVKIPIGGRAELI